MNNTFDHSAHSRYDIIPLLIQRQNTAINRLQPDFRIYNPEPLAYLPKNKLIRNTKNKRNHCLSTLSGLWSTNKEEFMPKIRIGNLFPLFSVYLKNRVHYGNLCMDWFSCFDLFYFFLVINSSFQIVQKYIYTHN